jgi:hypothetical protein
MGFTLIRHICYHCGIQNPVTTLTVAGTGDKCCSLHDEDIASPRRNVGEDIFTHDCCSLVTEQIIAVQVIRTEVQPEIIPFFQATTSQTIMPENDSRNIRLFPDNLQLHDGRDLMTMHCQILS